MAFLWEWQGNCMGSIVNAREQRRGVFDAVWRSVITRMHGGAGMTLAIEISDWAQEQFGKCELGGKRRTKRAVKIAAQAAAMPDAGTPQQTEGWGDFKT